MGAAHLGYDAVSQGNGKGACCVVSFRSSALLARRADGRVPHMVLVLALLAAPAVLAPTRVRPAPLCGTRSIRRAAPRCDLGSSSRRAALSRSAAAGASAVAAAIAPGAAQAAITKDSEWPLWLALPVAPYSRRKTIRREVGPGERPCGRTAARRLRPLRPPARPPAPERAQGGSCLVPPRSIGRHALVLACHTGLALHQACGASTS